MRATASVPRIESPPSAKKSSSTPTASTPRTSDQIAASSVSRGVRGLTYSTAAGEVDSRPSRSARPMRWTFPVGPLGISSTNARRRGTLNGASVSATNSWSEPSSTSYPGASTTAAATSSPNLASGSANVTACSTAGCVSSRSSTSIGAIFSPPRLISSFRRPFNVR